MASLTVFVSVLLGLHNYQITLAVVSGNGKQQIVRRSDRLPAAGVVSATFCEWVTGWYAGEYGVPAYLSALEAGSFGLTISVPKGHTVRESDMRAAIAAGLAAGKPAPVVTAEPTPIPAVVKTRKPRGLKKQAAE